MNTGTRVARWLRGRRAGIVVMLAVALATGALPAAQPAQAASGGLGRPDLPEQRDSDVRAVNGLGAKKARAAVAAARAKNSAQARRAIAEQHSAWPRPGRGTAAMPGSRTDHATTKPGGLPVTVAPGSVGDVAGGDATIRVLDRKATDAAGIKGVLLTATATEPGRAHLTLDYSAFASAYGGGWSERLGLVRLPACALTSPEKAACRTRTVLASDNDPAGRTVSADVAMASASSATVLALAATSGTSTSGAGDFSATPLASSSTTYAQIFDQDETPSGTYTRAEYGEAAQQTAITFDGAERPTANSLYVYGVKRWTTSTGYTGDSTATTALAGGSATRVITDALGRTVERREYAGTSPADAAYGSGTGTPYTSTAFTYTLDDKEATVTGPDNSVWSYTYDLYGRKVTSTDPDKGKTTTGYTPLDQVSWLKDAAGRVVISAYDTLGRVSGTWSAPATADLTSTTEEQVAANQLTAYTYDTLAKGQLDTAVRYVGGSVSSGTAYTKKITAYDALYRQTGTQIVLPAGDALVTKGAVPSDTLDFSSYYNIDGSLQYTKEPAAGGLAAEQVTTQYNGVGLPTSVSGASGYVLGTSYSALGETEQLTLGTSAATGTKKAYITNTFEEGTGRLTQSAVTDQTHGYELQELNYGYDDAGNVTSITDPTTLGGTSAADNQCFAHDGHQRLTEAWTPKTADCSATGRTAANLGGASPYWTSYAYQDSGLRSTETTHATGGDTKKTYCYDSTRVHTLAAVTTATSCTGVTAAYAYDATGNTTTRPDGTSFQSLVWNEEGDLGKLVEGSSTTGYVYDADGTLLIRRNTAGETVLYLGGTEVHLDTSTSTAKYWAQRYYTVGGSTVALRSNKSGTNTLNWLAADRHGTSGLAIEATVQGVVKRYSTPFGATRSGSTGTWVDDKGFLGKSADTGTGLTHLGAREYDPTTGRFISVDPVLSTDQAQSLNGYTYANNNPVTQSDPTGLESCGPVHFCSGSNGTYGTYKPENDPGSDEYDGSSHDADNGPPLLGAATGDKTTRHNQARDVAIRVIEMQVKKLGVKNFVIYKNMQVPTAAKKCMKTPNLPCGSYGVPDIVGYDPNHDVYYVWEVKSAGAAVKAVPEANWYVGKMRANGQKAVLGWTIGGPYPVVNGDKVIGPEPGAVIYGRPNDKKFKRILTPSPTNAASAQQGQPAQPTPQPTPGPGPGPFPGTIDQPGLGIVPQATDGVNQWPLLVPMVIVALPFAVEAGATAATVSISATVAATVFDLAA